MPMMSRAGANWMRARGSHTAVPATLMATRCASPAQVLTAKTGPMRSRKNVTAAETALNASPPSRITNTEASESNQFSAGHTMQIAAAKGKKRMKAKPGCGFASGEAKLARIAAPTKARIAVRDAATRMKLRASNERKRADRFVDQEKSSTARSL